MRSFLIKIISLLLFSNISIASDVDSIKWYMQDYPPFTYVDETSKNSGLVADLVTKLFAKLKAKKTIDNVEVVNFARGVAQITAEPETAFFTLVRLPERESLFKWVGPVGMNRPIILAKKSQNIKINSIEDLKKYTIGAKRKASIESILKKLGVEDKSLALVGADEESMKKFEAGRTDLIAINDLVGYFLMKKMKMNRDDYEIVYRLKEDTLAIAFNKSVSDDFINKMQMELDAMKVSKNGNLSEYDLLLRQYE